VTDANSCITFVDFTITEPTVLALTAAAQTNVSCNGGSNGSASVTPSGGTPGYTYSWSPSGGTAATATGLSAGTYTVTVTDANSCTTFVDFTITEPTVLALTAAAQTNVSCNGGLNGSASVTPSGGAGGYTYSWSPSGGTAATATGLSAGTYTVTVTDANSCTTFVDFTITEPTVLALTAASQTNVSCNGGATGTASVNIPTGGAGGYIYNWTPGNPTGDGTTSVSGLTAGTWTCTVTDANSCTTFVDFTITEPTAIDNNVTLSSGILQATEAGASYQWYLCPNTIITLDGTNQTYIPTVVGDYKVEITLGGCTVTSNCTTVTVLGNEKFDFENFSYYPNPTTGVVTITNSSILSEVSVVNLIGQTVLTKQGNNLEMQLDLSNLPSATYFVKVMSEGKIKTLKILKQ
ncbi:T9SS type A sorting domain-containing protein, partial [Flavobacterium facile]|uniref:T9SS type A sorting domain-containing protein n=1 Tax=Flavobacterium facile TaxID=2893174 RepID=UPI002E79B5D3